MLMLTIIRACVVVLFVENPVGGFGYQLSPHSNQLSAPSGSSGDQLSLHVNQLSFDTKYASDFQIPYVRKPPDDKLKPDEEIESSSEDDSHWDTDFLHKASSELPPGIDPDERLIKPSKYFGELEQLANEVYVHSAFGTLGQDRLRFFPPRLENLTIDFPYPKDRTKPNVDDRKALESCIALRVTLSGGPGHVEPITACIKVFLELLECRNIVCAVSDNITRLSQARFCTNYISFLALETDRFVAKMVILPVNDLKLFDDLFNNALNTRYEYILNLTEKFREESGHTQEYLELLSNGRSLNEEHRLSQNCRSFLKRTLDLEPVQSLYDEEIWRGLVHTLDLAVLSYSSAHVGTYPVRIS